jgi:hypothetical protein
MRIKIKLERRLFPIYITTFEFLVLELIEAGGCGLNGSDVLSVARSLGLDKDYHYDVDFWDKLNSHFTG